jgi:hypothetical protein
MIHKKTRRRHSVTKGRARRPSAAMRGALPQSAINLALGRRQFAKAYGRQLTVGSSVKCDNYPKENFEDALLAMVCSRLSTVGGRQLTVDCRPVIASRRPFPVGADKGGAPN